MHFKLCSELYKDVLLGTTLSRKPRGCYIAPNENNVHAGYPEYELVPGGNEIDVVASNAGDYVAAVVEATLHKGIQRQMDAFRLVDLNQNLDFHLSKACFRHRLFHSLHTGLDVIIPHSSLRQRQAN